MRNRGFREHLPLDPGCPEVVEHERTMWNDPITVMSGCGEEIQLDFERKHRTACKRCLEYGCANIEIVGGP